MGQESLNHYACTDLGNVKRFVEQHRHHLRATGHKSSWYFWDGCRWKITGERRAHSLAVETVIKISEEAEALKDTRQYEETKRWAKQSQSDARINALWLVLALRAFYANCSVRVRKRVARAVLAAMASGLGQLTRRTVATLCGGHVGHVFA